MARGRNPNRDKAFELYKENEGKISPREISNILREKVENIYVWKSSDKWDSKLQNKVGAPKGNNNAKGNDGGAPVGNNNAKKRKKAGAPKGNLNNLKNGKYYNATVHLEESFLKKYLPTATKNIIKGTIENGLNSLDILWTNIQLQFAAVIRSQKIMEVKNKGEMIKELKKIKVSKDIPKGESELVEVYREEEFEFQFAWDRQATFLTSQSKAMATLVNMISKYEELLHKNWELANEEQKHRVEKFKLQVLNLELEYNKNKLDKNKNFNPYVGLTTDELKKMINDG